MPAVMVALALLLLPAHTSQETEREGVIIWNVGQGQWITWVTSNHCLHVDAGGRISNQNLLRRFCSKKINRFILSHWDWDHVGLIRQLRKALPQTCLEMLPLGETSPRKKKLLSRFHPCPTRSKLMTIWSPKPSHFSPPTPLRSNEKSHITLIQNEVLVPGDSDCRMEKQWSTAIDLSKVRVLILGHHGSRTSTCAGLLSRLPRLRIAVASAEFKRYGHPHEDVLRRLRKKKVSVLTTETFGTLFIEMKTVSPTNKNLD